MSPRSLFLSPRPTLPGGYIFSNLNFITKYPFFWRNCQLVEGCPRSADAATVKLMCRVVVRLKRTIKCFTCGISFFGCLFLSERFPSKDKAHSSSLFALRFCGPHGRGSCLLANIPFNSLQLSDTREKATENYYVSLPGFAGIGCYSWHSDCRIAPLNLGE